jgi:hypothetical protein
LGISLVALLKKRYITALSFIFATVMTGWLIFAHQENLWVTDYDLYLLCKKASLIVPPDNSVASITEIERQMVFHLGKDILPADMVRERMEKNYGKEHGYIKWREWIISERGPKWIFALYKQQEEMRGMGFIPVIDSGPDTQRHSQWFLFRKT